MVLQNKNIARYRRVVTKINKLEKEFAELRDNDFSARTSLLKMRIRAGESLDKILPDAFALVREVAKRTMGMRAFNVQLQGAVATHEEKIVEMKTGEGKTLTIAFVAFLNSLVGKGVHVVTANDYLAKRDAKWMEKLYSSLGVSVGYIVSQTGKTERQISYAADITYVSNNEVGFDFLKDNMLYDKQNKSQRELYLAIVDEADSVLIDEAQTPLVISGSDSSEDDNKQIFVELNSTVRKLKKEIDYEVNQKERTIALTKEGIKKLETLLGVGNLYDSDVDYLYFIERLLKAHVLFMKDRDYIIEDKQIVIVDEFTGRLMPSHRYYQGVHQAIEAKEGLGVQSENKTLASTTFQHFFKRYEKMAGLTGTAMTAKKEFRMIYRKEVVQISTNKPVVRNDVPDRFFLNWNDKFKYLSWFVQEHYFKKRPMLIGTRSVKRSHEAHLALMKENIPSSVLNAKHTAREAEVIAVAGQSQTMTVATNMAGRGTDIEIADSVRDQGGLIVLGMERHNSRRIDNQLIGRTGRQGDPGLAQFLISAEDELIKTYFKEDYVAKLKNKKNWPDGVSDASLQAILNKAQKRMENLFFDQRMLGYEFDRVLEAQRTSFYRQRNRVLLDEDLQEETLGLLKKYVYRHVILPQKVKGESLSKEGVEIITGALKKVVINKWFRPDFEARSYSVSEVRAKVYDNIEKYYFDFEHYVSSSKMRSIEKIVTLKVLDLLWIGHLGNVEEIQEATLISSINKANFFEEYEIEMTKRYKEMLYSIPQIVSLTMFRTMNTMLSVPNNNKSSA